MELNRKPSDEEKRLLDFLINKSSMPFAINWESELYVRSMNDDGMGSLLIIPKNVEKENRIFGRQICEYEYHDSDGIKVIISLNIDKDGDLFEIDIWKTNFEKLISYPNLPPSSK